MCGSLGYRAWGLRVWLLDEILACCHIFEYRWARMEPDEYGNHAPALAIWEVLKRIKTAWSAKPP